MKKIMLLFAVVALSLVSLTANAQLKFGVKGGLNLSKLTISESDLSGDNKTGWFIGPMAEFTIPLIGIGADVSALYSQSKIGTENADATVKSIEVPINLKWSAGLGSTLGVYVAAGPQFGYNIGDSWDSYLHMKKSTTSFNVGAGVKLIKHIQAGVNYNFALSNTAEIKIDDKKIEAKNNTWQVSVAYIF